MRHCFTYSTLIIVCVLHASPALPQLPAEPFFPETIQETVSRYLFSEGQIYNILQTFNHDAENDPFPHDFALNTSLADYTDVYYDTRSLDTFSQGVSVSIRSLTSPERQRNPAKKIYIKSYQQHIEQEEAYDHVAYGRVTSPLDKHELFGRVKRIGREHFVKRIKAQGIDAPEKMARILELVTQSIDYRVERRKHVFLEFNIAKIEANLFGITKKYHLLVVRRSLENLNRLEPLEREWIEQYREGIETRLAPKIEEKIPQGVSPYTFVLENFQQSFSFIFFLIQYPFVYQLMQALFFIFLGGMLLVLLFYKRVIRDTPIPSG